MTALMPVEVFGGIVNKRDRSVFDFLLFFYKYLLIKMQTKKQDKNLYNLLLG